MKIPISLLEPDDVFTYQGNNYTFAIVEKIAEFPSVNNVKVRIDKMVVPVACGSLDECEWLTPDTEVELI